MPAPQQSAHQLDTLRIYGALVAMQEVWAGRLVLCCGEGSSLSGIPAAVSIAGGAALVIDTPAAAKSAMHVGELDFVVNTLDEAMRTLKNEVRKHRPLSVGLTAATDLALSEIVERGILPDLLLVPASQSPDDILQRAAIQSLRAHGMAIRLMAGSTHEQPANPTPSEGFREVYLPAAGAVEQRSIDERLLSILPLDDAVRRRWLQHVPQYLREARTGGRWVWLTDRERRHFGA